MIYQKKNNKLVPLTGSCLYADAPIGAITPYGGTAAPSGWLLCQGQAVSRTDYSALFGVIGTTYGAGDGATTFNLPDFHEATTNYIIKARQVALPIDLKEQIIEYNHNVPRVVDGHLGKDITAYYQDGTLYQRLDGTNGFSPLEDIFTGDYFQMSRAVTAPNQDSQYATTGTSWVTIAGIDTLMGNGDSLPSDCLDPASGKHHLVLIPGKGDTTEDNHFGRKRMNSTDTTSGGYWGSEMRSATLGDVATSGSTASNATINQQLYAEFGGHLKTIREVVSNDIEATYENRYHTTKGASRGWAWQSVQSCLMTEVEAYGSIAFSSSGFDTGAGCTRLPLFAYSKGALSNRKSYYWLRDVACASFFCRVNVYGRVDYGGASGAYSGVRPRFVIGA